MGWVRDLPTILGLDGRLELISWDRELFDIVRNTFNGEKLFCTRRGRRQHGPDQEGGHLDEDNGSDHDT